MITISICLSDIPKEKMKKANNGKVYVNLVVAPRKEADQYENTHTVFVNRTKEEREANATITYVGNGKEVKPAPVTSSDIEQMPPVDPENDDLPF